MTKPTTAARITTEFFAEDCCAARLEGIIQRLIDEQDAEIFHLEDTISNLRESLETHFISGEVLKKGSVEIERLKIRERILKERIEIAEMSGPELATKLNDFADELKEESIPYKDEIERLKQQLADVIYAVDAEPELPGRMPAELLEKVGQIGVEQSMKSLVRLTKDCIKKRIQKLTEATNPD